MRLGMRHGGRRRPDYCRRWAADRSGGVAPVVEAQAAANAVTVAAPNNRIALISVSPDSDHGAT